MDEYQLVRIEWHDAYGCGAEWSEIDELMEAPKMSCYSVGWLVFENDDLVVLVPHLSEQGHAKAKPQGCGDMTIPKSAIRSMKRID